MNFNSLNNAISPQSLFVNEKDTSYESLATFSQKISVKKVTLGMLIAAPYLILLYSRNQGGEVDWHRRGALNISYLILKNRLIQQSIFLFYLTYSAFLAN